MKRSRAGHRFLHGLLLTLALWPALVSALSPEEARHLLGRSAFGEPPATAKALLGMSRAQAVDAVIVASREETEPAAPLPQWADGHWLPSLDKPSRANKMERRKFNQRTMGRQAELRGWWLAGMVRTQAPLRERMTLFWHNRFPSSFQEVPDERLLFRQNQTYREMALGNFGDLLKSVYRDPAMNRYLDLRANRRGAPNENFARELLELFTIGPGYYTETDIREAARAFTGTVSVRRLGVTMQWYPWHDFGVKTVLGSPGRFDGDDVIDLVLAHPRTSERLVEALWQEFISPKPDPKEVQRLAASFRRDYEIEPLLRSMLLSDAFWAPANRGCLVKSPVDPAVGSYRVLGIDPGSGVDAANQAAAMGQELFNPPNVKGWPSGEGWISTQTLVERLSFCRSLAARAPAVRGLPPGVTPAQWLLPPGPETASVPPAETAELLGSLRYQLR